MLKRGAHDIFLNEARLRLHLSPTYATSHLPSRWLHPYPSLWVLMPPPPLLPLPALLSVAGRRERLRAVLGVEYRRDPGVVVDQGLVRRDGEQRLGLLEGGLHRRGGAGGRHGRPRVLDEDPARDAGARPRAGRGVHQAQVQAGEALRHGRARRPAARGGALVWRQEAEEGGGPRQARRAQGARARAAACSEWPSWRGRGWPPAARRAASEGLGPPSTPRRSDPSPRIPPGGRGPGVGPRQTHRCRRVRPPCSRSGRRRSG